MNEELIKENCPLLTEVVESLSQPKQLGAEGSRRLTTYVYGMLLNGYSPSVTREETQKIFGVFLEEEDIMTIECIIDFESKLASMEVKL